ATGGLQAIKDVLTGSSDIETLLTLQASLAKSTVRYKHLIEILLDGKDMNIIPSRMACSQVSHSFVLLGDFPGQLAWDTAVQEIYPGFKPTAPFNTSAGIQDEGHHASPPHSQPNGQVNGQINGQVNGQINGPVNGHINGHSLGYSSTLSMDEQQQPSHQTTRRNNNNVRKPSPGTNIGTNTPSYNSSNGRHRNPAAQVLLRYKDASEAIIRACRSGYAAVALEEISKMVSQNLIPTPQAIAETIQVCVKREKKRTTDFNELYRLAMRSLDTVTDIVHRRMAEYEVYNAMLVANATLGDMNQAKKNYDDILKLGQYPDATGYATLLIATTTSAVDEANDALQILEEVKRHHVKPNIFFYNVVIGKLSRGRKIERVLEVYEEMIANNIRPNSVTYGTLISACTRVGSEEMARNLFSKMTSSPTYTPRQGPHNAMIQFYVRQKKDRTAALEYYADMQARKLQPTEHTYTLLIEAYACIQPYDMTKANRLIQSLKRGPIRATEAHYGALIHAYGVVHGDISSAQASFENMCRSGIVPKGPAYQSLIESLIANKRVSEAVQVRNELLASGQPSNAYIENTLIRGYGHERNLRAAEEVFHRMADPLAPKVPGAIVKEPSSYQSMVTAYLENKRVKKAYATLAKMKNQQYPELVIKPVEEAIHAATNRSPDV
ncbi:hypothetical protein BGZ94_002651, partial [Podila epigama]